MSSMKYVALLAAFVISLPSASVYAACQTNTCGRTYVQCVRATGGDPDGACEAQYYQCLMNHGCPIP